MLSSADGYCSIVVFDLAELGTVHPTQQHHRQLQAIAQSHSHPHSVPHSPAVSQMRQSPAPPSQRSEREGSTASSVAGPPSIAGSLQSLPVPPLPLFGLSGVTVPPPPSSTTSSTEPVPRTPVDEPSELQIVGRIGRSESASSTTGPPQVSLGGLGLQAVSGDEGPKRPAPPAIEGDGADSAADGGPKKKRRVALTHLGEGN